MTEPFVFYQLQAPGHLALLPDPEGVGPNTLPGDGQIICRTLASALSPGTELSAYRGDPPLRPQAVVYPRLVGYCNVAAILACGSNVPSDLHPGDRILTLQSHRSGFTIPHQAVLAKLPTGLDATTASVTYLFQLGYAAFLKSGAIQGDNAAILGLGTLGLTSAALFANGGVPMTAFSNFRPTVETADAFGLRAVRPKLIADQAGQFDHVVVTTNGWKDWQLALDLCRPGGKITVLGFPGRGQPLPDFNPLGSSTFYDKQLSIQSCGYTPNGATESRRDQPRALRHNIAFLVDAIASGRLPAKSLISVNAPYTMLDRVYKAMQSGERSALTTVLNWKTTDEM